MLKTTGSSEESPPRAFRTGNNEVLGGGNRADETVVNLFKSKNKKSRKLTCMPNIVATGELNFLTPNAKKVFNLLQLAFIKVLILQHFDLESHIRIETNASSYAIGEILSQLNLDFYTPPNNSNLNKSDFG